MNIFETLQKLADPVKAAPMAAYMRNQFPFLGILKQDSIKHVNEFLKNVDKSSVDWKFVQKCWKMPEREFQSLACDYFRKVKKVLSPADIPNLREIIVTKSWWDTVDTLHMIFAEMTSRHPEINKTLLAWSKDDNIWLRRTAIIHQLSRRTKTDTKLLEKIITNCFGTDEFFINKAIGWALREYSKTDAAWVRDFIGRHKSKMGKLSIREASKYI